MNPPKPERESNRRRKKKNLSEDFIDITDPSSLYLLDYQKTASEPGNWRVSLPTQWLAQSFEME